MTSWVINMNVFPWSCLNSFSFCIKGLSIYIYTLLKMPLIKFLTTSNVVVRSHQLPSLDELRGFAAPTPSLFSFRRGSVTLNVDWNNVRTERRCFKGHERPTPLKRRAKCCCRQLTAVCQNDDQKLTQLSRLRNGRIATHGHWLEWQHSLSKMKNCRS